ncbi:MAG: Lcl domain-containing protein [Pseudobdellovibrionaceae bacterium]
MIKNLYKLYAFQILLLAPLFFAFLSGCSGSSSGHLRAESVAAVLISPVTKTVPLGGTLDFEASGGVRPYTFDVYFGSGTISSSGATGTFQAPVAEGTAVIRVQDKAGSAGYATVEITEMPLIQPSSKTLAVSNQYPFGALSGKAPYVFSVVSGVGTINATTGEFTAGATAGAVVLRLTDAAGRSADANVTVNSPLSCTAKTAYVQKETTYTVAAIGGVPPYKFFIASGEGRVDKSTGVFTAPSALGVTAIHVVDSVGNFDLATLTTTTALSISPSNILIAKNGSLTFSSTGGVPPYSYTVQAGGLGSIGVLTGQYVAPNISGTETVRVTDAAGHISDASVTITNNNLSFSVANLTLAVGNSIDISTLVNGGVAPLTYIAESSQGLFTGSVYTAPNVPGTYQITVHDSQALTPNSVTATILVNSALSLLPTTAAVSVNAEKVFSASGGVPPYTYSKQSGSGSISSSGLYTAPASNGTAILLVTDARGNTATASVTIHDALTIVPTTKTLSAGEAFTFNAVGGTSPYIFSLVSGSGSINSSTGLYIAPGAAGLATVRVEDALGNHNDALITILNPLSITPPSISLIKNGVITFTASGGTGPYTYSVISGEGSVNATSGAFSASAMTGITTVRVTDSLGNIKDATVLVHEGLTISPFTKILAVNQVFSFTASGGVPPYTYTLTSGVGIVSSSGTYSAGGAGAAVVRVTDKAGSTSEANIIVNSALSISPTSKTLAVNNSFTFSAAGGVPPYIYSVLSGSGTVSSSGDYKAPTTSTTAVVRVTDSASNTADATVTVNDPLAISPSTVTLAAGGTQSFVTAGGVPPYAYSIISGGGSFSSATYTAPSIASGASVIVLVTDLLGNTANTTITINPITVSIGSPNNSALITASNKAAFTVSGTCSESGRVINVSATGGISASPTCSNGTWSTILNLTSVAEGDVTITAAHSNVNSVAATPATVTLTKDSSTPTITITSPTASSYVSNSVTITGTCTKAGPVNFSVTGGITGITSCNGSSFSSPLDISLASEGAITISAAHTDNAGNSATPATVNVIKDSTAPVITAFAVTNTSPTNSTTYNLTSTVVEANSLTHYCILENSTLVANCTWQSGTMPSTFTVSSINNAKVLTAWVKDAAGNISASVSSNAVTLDTAVPAAPSALSLSNPSTSPGNNTTPTLSVSGVGVGDSVAIYTDSGCATAAKGTATVSSGSTVTVTSSVLTAASYTFYAKRTNSAGTASDCSTANASYVLDLTAPTSPSISVNAGATYTTSITVSLTLAATGADYMYVTNTAGCSSGGTYEAYATSKASWTLATANATNMVYVKFKDLAGNETSCVSDGILHDNTGPDAPTGLSLGAVPISDTTTPTLSWTAPSDNAGGSGVASYQVEVYKTADNSVISGCSWTTSTSGSALTCNAAALVNGTQYYMKVRAVDNAGNLGTAATSAIWTAQMDTCLGTPTPGTVCLGGAIYLGSLSPGATSGSGTDRYMTTPGGCGEIPVAQQGGGSGASAWPNADFTPTCSGTDSLTKSWNDGSGNWFDIVGLTNYSSTMGTAQGSTNTDQYYGSGNTTNIVAITSAGQGGYHAAARYCDKLSYGGYTDWYLPNRYELNLMYTNKVSIPGLDTTGNYYWSSTETNNSSSWIQKFNDGYQSYDIKDHIFRLRCVRRF